jgi:hypothetical protein
MSDITAGDFVVVEGRVGVVSHRRAAVEHHVGRWCVDKPGVEVWFGETGENGLPITRIVATDKCINIKMASRILPLESEKV